MNVERAQEIVAAKDFIPVMNQGISVWIDKVNASEGTARVHEESDESVVMTVPVEQLIELQQ